MKQGSLMDYFVAGIRALGTWGAARHIDRKYADIAALMKDDEDDLQILLEVVYKDEQIIDQIDVSDKPCKYFEEQCRQEVVQRNIKEYRGENT